MGLPWDPYLVQKDKPRYYSVTKLKYYPIIRKRNNWFIMYFIDKETDEKECESVQK